MGLDDLVADIVRCALEGAVFESTAEWRDFPANKDEVPAQPSSVHKDAVPPSSWTKVDLTGDLKTVPAANGHHFRAVRVPLRDDTAIIDVAEAIGRQLWRILSAGLETLPPPDFATRHLVIAPSHVMVWSVQGVAIAYMPSAHQAADRQMNQIESLAQLSTRLSAQLESKPSEHSLAESEQLMLELTKRKSNLAAPEWKAIRSFADSIEFGESLATVRDLHSAAAERVQERLSHRVESVEIFILTVYVTELLKTIVELWPHREKHELGLRIVTGVSFLFLGGAWLGLNPSRHWRGKKAMWIIPAMIGLMLILGFVSTWLVVEKPEGH